MPPPRQIELDLLRKDLDSGGPVGGDLLEVGALGDPLPQGLVVARARHQCLPSLVGNVCQGLLQHEGFIDMDAVETSSAQVVDQRLVVVLRIVAAERELEAVLPFGRTMAGPGVTAGPAQDGFDVPDESHFGRGDALDLDLQASALARGGDQDR